MALLGLAWSTNTLTSTSGYRAHHGATVSVTSRRTVSSSAFQSIMNPTVISPAGSLVDQECTTHSGDPSASASSNASDMATRLDPSTPTTTGCPVGRDASPRHATTGHLDRAATTRVSDPTNMAAAVVISSLPSTISRASRLSDTNASSTGAVSATVLMARSGSCSRTASAASFR